MRTTLRNTAGAVNRRRRILGVVCSESEARLLRAGAKQQAQSVSSFLRERGLSLARQLLDPVLPVDVQEEP